MEIKNISKEVKLELKRPFYALKKIKFNMEDPRGEDSYWKAEGVTKVFLNKLKDCLSQSEEIREEGYISKDDKYVLYYDIQKIQSVFRESSLGELFQGFDNLKTINMLSGISIPIELQGGGEADISFFSDGQFQSVYVYAIVEFFKDRHCLTLLDEPDSFLHPEWQAEFLKQIDDISDHDISKNHILLSSHSAATLVGHSLNQKNQKISFFDLNEKNNKVICYSLGKPIAVQKLSNNLITYIEEQSVLSIFQKANDPKKPLLLVEGFTDVVIINAAWRKLYQLDIPFAILYATSCTLLPVILKNNDCRMAVFGLFDFDKAFSLWDGLEKWDCIQEDPLKGLIKQNKEKEIYAFMLPIPDHEKIKRQAIKEDTTAKYGTYGDKTCCTIEHLFYREETKKYFKEESVSGGGSHIKFNSDKKGFAEKVIPSLDKSYFEIFRPLFEFVMSKCPDDEKKKFTQSYLQS